MSTGAAKTRLLPLYFDPGRDAGFDAQLANLQTLLGDVVEFLEPAPLGSRLPDADAALFPQFLGEGYRRLEDFKKLTLPMLVITSEVGTLSMWDWELLEYLRGQGVEAIAPYSLEQTRKIIAALRVKRQLKAAKFLVFQDNPGEGAQAPIFKRFYWWEDECKQRMLEKFGITIERKSFKALGAAAKNIPDQQAETELKTKSVPGGLTGKPLLSAVKLYLAIRGELDADPTIQGVGVNCLNESHFSDTTPCLAWNWLYGERKMIWGCEADVVSMITKHIVHHSLDVPIMMTNLYPFLMGQAALKHERIAAFPKVEGDPANHILVAHCGYMGVIPQAFATRWSLKLKVLRIVDDNASAIDADLPTGPITLVKLHPDMNRMTIAQGTLKGYAGYPGSDCLNGGIVEVRDGHKLMSTLASHHYLLTTGHNLVDLRFLAKVFGLTVEEM